MLRLPATVASAVVALALWTPAQAPGQIAARAEDDFGAGRLADALAGYDRLVALVPSVAPELWQRGIVLYYLGRYDECAAQFAAFHEHSPADMENTAWHFFCEARAVSPTKARAGLLATESDPRVGRNEVYDLLRGTVTPADFARSADSGMPIVRFYSHLYLGLYLDAIGDPSTAIAQIRIAASDEYRPYGGFMNVVAHVHLRLRTAATRTPLS
jgi:lipoprotein NlpI